MFKHILVPLDGSRLAESALAMAASLARKFDASLTLIHVIEKDAPSEIHSETAPCFRGRGVSVPRRSLQPFHAGRRAGLHARAHLPGD